MIGLSRADDAGVYRVSESLALIQTVDFFTPIVDDPHSFGRIAAANALSDVYAMGGVPKTAMNLVGFPAGEMDISVLRSIIKGGAEKVAEAGAVLIGGHSVEDPELKYGLSVTGFAHPDRVLAKKTLKPGTKLILTKPLGTGIINTAIKGGVAPAEVIENATRIMEELNRTAAESMEGMAVRACTDITGFGLLGHAAEMVEGTDCSIRFNTSAIPIIPEAVEYAKMGLIPAGTYKNQDFRGSMTSMGHGIEPFMADILFDPQTSGGLLICIDSDDQSSKNGAEGLLEVLHKNGVEHSAIIGDVVEKESSNKVYLI